MIKKPLHVLQETKTIINFSKAALFSEFGELNSFLQNKYICLPFLHDNSYKIQMVDIFLINMQKLLSKHFNIKYPCEKSFILFVEIAVTIKTIPLYE